MRNDWNGLLKVLEAWKTDAAGNVVWRSENLYNTFHLAGEQFMLQAAFTGGQDSTVIPNNYYFGLDSRSTLAAADTMTTIVNSGNEPATNGYSRVAVASSDMFIVSLVNDHYRAYGPILSFAATGGSWGPVTKLFLTTANDDSGPLIASVALNTTLTLAANEAFNVRMGLSLKDC